MNWLIIFGLLFNSALITLNRFWRKLPDWLYLGGMIVGVAAIVLGAIMTKNAG